MRGSSTLGRFLVAPLGPALVGLSAALALVTAELGASLTASAARAQLGRRAQLGPPLTLEPALPEAPPAEPPAAPCGACSPGCGAGPRGIENVYLHSGELHLETRDLVVPGRGLDFVWARSYRSRLGPDTAQGNGWDFSYNVRVSAEGADVRVMDGNGRSDVYRLRPDGTYASAQLFREGSFGPGGEFTLSFADTGAWVFFPLDGTPLAGRLKSIVDRNGNTLGFDYDGLGRLTLVVDTLGRQYQLAYDSSGHLANLTDFSGRQVVYSYYGAAEPGGSPGDLKSARSPVVVGTPNGNDFPSGKTTVYTYSKGFADDRLNHNLLTATDPRGATWLVNEYSSAQGLSFDRLVRQQRGDPGDLVDVTYAAVQHAGSAALMAIVNDAVGNVAEHVYDLAGRCVELRRLTGRADPDQPTTRTSNRPGPPLRPGDPPAFVTRWSYNADSLVTQIVHPEGNLTQNTWESDLDPLAPPRSRGNLRERLRLPGTHAPAGDQPFLLETFEYAAGLGGCCGGNFVTRATDARGNVTEHDYDSRGNRIQTRHRIPSIVEDYTYNVFGQITSHTHPDNGKGWRQVDVWTYYAAPDPRMGYLQSEVLDAVGEALTTTWSYDSRGNAVSVTDARGNATGMVFNALDQLVREISPAVQTLGGPLVQYTTDTWYDADDNVVRVDTSNLDDQGNPGSNPTLTTTMDYEVLNRPIRKTVEVDVGHDVVTEYEYDAKRNRTLVRHGEATNGAQPANVERFVYDERDLVFLRIRAEGAPEQSTTQHDYDRNGSPVRTVSGLEEPAPRVRTLVVDAYGRKVLETDPMGNVATTGYDANANVVHLRFDGETCDVQGGAGNVRLYEAHYVFDAMDRCVQSTAQHFESATQDPIGDGTAVGSWSWTDRSQVATATDDRGNVTTSCYDTLGRRELVTDARGNSVRAVYDENDNVVQVVETEKQPGGAGDLVFTSLRAYDALDRQVLEQNPVGEEFALGYDSRDNLTTIVDPEGNVTKLAFDGLDRQIASSRMLRSPLGVVIGTIDCSWDWDDSSRLVGRTDDNGNKTAMAYDGLGRLVRTVLADGRIESLDYDAHGNVVGRVDPNGTTSALAYDLADRLAGVTVTPGAGVSSDTTFEVWKHDGLSRLVHAEDDDTLVTCAWDSLGNRIREVQNGKSITCSHDGVGNEVAVTYPSGKNVTYGYDLLNRMQTVATGGGTLVGYEYVGPWRLLRRNGGGGFTPLRRLQNTYDGARRKTAVQSSLVGIATLDHHTYQWDGMDDRTAATDVLTGVKKEFSYDSVYRMTRARDLDPMGTVLRDVQYAFDGVGNRTSVTGGACPGPYLMNPTLPEPADRAMNQYTSTPCAGALVYDPNGNQVSRGAGEALVYDYRDRLVLHQGPGGTTAYAYDALGRNVAKVGATPAETVRYAYHGEDVVEERDGNDVLLRSFVRGRSQSGVERTWEWAGFNPQPEPPIGDAVGHEVVAMDTPGGRFYFYSDDLGSTRVVTNAAGTVVERYRYDEAGSPSFEDGSGSPLPGSAIGNAWLFTGQRWDEETGFYAFPRRFLDPLLGQFLTRDPLGVWGDPVNLGNARTYVANNFQTLLDPMGTFTKACSGPWSGSKSVSWSTTDCSNSYAGLSDAMCRAAAGAYRARRTARLWVSYEQTGYPGGWSWLVGAPFLEWFGGPDGVIPGSWQVGIRTILEAVYEPFRVRETLGIECESSCDSGVGAYVAGYDSNIHICPLWWNTTVVTTPQRRASILLHELSHDRAGTDDHFYHFSQTKASTVRFLGMELPNSYETDVLATNADTYEGLYLDWFVK